MVCNDKNAATENAAKDCTEIVNVKQGATGKNIVESIVGEVNWLTDTEGYCACPGKDLHNNPDGRRDCVVYLDHVPTFYCVHGSCKSSVEIANRSLRKALLDGDAVTKRKLTAEDKARTKEAEHRLNIRKRAANSKAQILRDHSWTYDQILTCSPNNISGSVEDHWKLLLGCFPPDDLLWIGDIRDTGKPEHQRHFHHASDWLKEVVAPAQLICPSTFKSNSYSRSNDNVLVQRFLVVESDVLGRDEVGAVFRWMEQKVGLKLRAVVDTAGKSLHAWFDYPPAPLVDELKLILPELGCDPKLFTASQPVRLPGALRDGKHQKLIYLSKEVA